MSLGWQYAGSMDITTFPIQHGEFQAFDFAVENGALAAGSDLRTAIILSLFCDRRAETDDVLPDPSGSRRGWWGDALMPRPLGSRLWLLSREKQIQDVVNRAQEYAAESLKWLLDDLILDELVVSAEVVAFGILGLAVRVCKPYGRPETYQFNYLWQDASLQVLGS